MIKIRNYQESDAENVGILIADTFSAFNLNFLALDERGPFLGPFQFARSKEKTHQEAIVSIVKSAMLFVAEDDGKIVGVLRGRRERLASLFVSGDHQRQGIGRKLVKRFEQESIKQGVTVIRVAATLYAVPFYTAMGYKRSTGLRVGRSFEGQGLPVQPMRKVLKNKQK